jgi:hypothetical protein
MHFKDRRLWRRAMARALVLAVSAGLLVATSATAASAADYTYNCSQWWPNGPWEYRACIERNPTNMRHVVEFKNMTNVQGAQMVGLKKVVAGTVQDCFNSAVWLGALARSSRSCYSSRNPGVPLPFQTWGRTGTGQWMIAPRTVG